MSQPWSADEENAFVEAIGSVAPAERSRYLDRFCEGDQELRQRMVTLMRSRGLELPEPVAPPTPPALPPEVPVAATESGASAPPPAEPAPAEASPEAVAAAATEENRIGPYKLLGQIAEDGLGVLYLAEGAEPDRREVALKVITAGVDAAQVVARFEAELTILATLEHPLIAKVLDGGTTPLGLPFFVTEVVKGTPITDYAKQAGLSIPQKLEWFLNLVLAVQQAHEWGVIHGAIRPPNILVTEANGRPELKITNFGIARAVHERLTKETLFTETGELAGRPAYMSPEQVGPADTVLDARSDVYSLGVLLHELLTGQEPFPAEEVLVGAGFEELVRTICEAPPSKPSTKVAGLGGLDAIVLRALEKDPDQRYQSASLMAEAVMNYLQAAPEPVVEALPEPVAPPTPAPQPIAEPEPAFESVSVPELVPETYAEPVFAAAEVAEAIPQPEPVPEPIVEPVEVSVPEPLAEPVFASVSAPAPVAPPPQPIPAPVGSKAPAPELIQQPTLQPTVEPGVQVANFPKKKRMGLVIGGVVVLILVVGGLLSMQMSRMAREAKQTAEQANQRSLQAMRDSESAKAETQKALQQAEIARQQAEANDRRAQMEAAKNAQAELAQRLAQDLRSQPAAEAELRAKLATTYLELGQLTNAVAMYREVLDMRRKLFGNAHTNVADSLNDLGVGLARSGRHSEAEATFQEALNTRRKLLGEDHPGTIQSFTNVFNSLVRQGKSNAVEQLFTDALASSTLGPARKASLLDSRNRWRTPPAEPPKAVAMITPTATKKPVEAPIVPPVVSNVAPAVRVPPKPTGDADALFTEGDAKYAKGDLVGALEDYTRAIAIRADFALAYNHRGATRKFQGDLDGALADFNKTIELQPQDGIAYFNRGLVKRAKNDLEGTLADYDKAISLKPDYADAFNARGSARSAKNDMAGAVSDLNKALGLNPNFVVAYYNRGEARRATGDVDGSMADFAKAIELKPDFAEALFGRGIARRTKGDLNGALADLTKAIENKPDYVQAYNNRGTLRRSQGDLEGAAADYTKAIELTPRQWPPYLGRGVIRYDQHSFAQAVLDFKKVCELNPKSLDYGHLRLWLGQARAGDKDTATKELRAYLQNRTGKADEWTVRVARFLCGDLSEPDFLKASDSTDKKIDTDQKCEAYFYAGTKQLVGGDSAKAKEYFDKCVATGRTTFEEYRSATAELALLK